MSIGIQGATLIEQATQQVDCARVQRRVVDVL